MSTKDNAQTRGDTPMLIINTTIDGDVTIFELEGRLDTMTSPELDQQVREILPDATALVFDFTKLKYISSAGLRVLLNAQKNMSDRGGVKLVGVNPIILEILDATGFSEILIIE